MSNSNFEITDFTVDATSQELTSVKINNKSFGSNVSLEDNKAATINASTYTAPVEVTPTSGKDGMKKATITLSNIPAAFDASKLTFSKLESMPVGAEPLADFAVTGAEANLVYYGVYYDSDYIGYIIAGVKTSSPQP